MKLNEHTLSSVTLALETVWESCKIAVEIFPEDERDITYRQVRSWLKEHPAVFSRCPEILKDCINLAAVRRSLKDYSSSYAPRRELVDREFDDAIDSITTLLQDPLSNVDYWLVELNSSSARIFWDKTKTRIRVNDYDGAITASRSFLETVIKELLSELGKPVDGNEKLPELWRKIGDELNLLPTAHEEEGYKKILGNMQSVVSGIANIRNTQGDAHGSIGVAPRPTQRHAELVVNLSSAMAQYLIEAWSAKSD